MRAITIKQPFAEAIRLGLKPWENRPRALVRESQVVAIHAGLQAHELAADAYRLAPGMAPLNELPRGAIVALAILDPAVDAATVAGQDWVIGPLCHRVREVRPLAQPVPCRGQLGAWTVPPDVEAAVWAALD